MSTYGITISNETDFTVPTEQILAMLQHHYDSLFLGPQVELSITFVTEDTIEDLHIQWLDLSGPTDVMSFPMDELQAGKVGQLVLEGTLGDIVVCPSVAAAQAQNHSVEDEILLLITHGLLHLLGHDHYDAEEKKRMFSLQDQLLSSHLGRKAPFSSTAGQQ